MDLIPQVTNRFDNNCVKGQILFNKYTIVRNVIKKFAYDKVFMDSTNYIIITDGVILNAKTLCKDYSCNTLEDLIIRLYNEIGDPFFRLFRGSFSGALYDKLDDKWIFFTNQMGDKPLFYYKENGKFIIASQVNYILSVLRTLSIPLSVNNDAIYKMMTYGFIDDDTTYAHEILRLPPGCYALTQKNKDLTIHQYYKLEYNKIDLSRLKYSDIIEELDLRFQNAIRLEYDKDIEYNYRHIADISGGLDSRMNVIVSHELGYENVVNLTYGQSDYLDEKIAKQVAFSLGNELLIKPLNDNNFLYDIDENISMNFGLSQYAALTGRKRLLDILDKDIFGLEHTGQLGDVIIGSFLKNDKQNYNSSSNCVGYSNHFVHKIGNIDFAKYSSRELFLLNGRGIHGVLASHLIRQNYTEVASPFLDVDLIDFCLSIPIKLREGHRLYFDWISAKHPNAAEFKWEKINAYINIPRFLYTAKKVILKGPRKILRILGIHNKKTAVRNMNPYDYWYSTNTQFRECLDSYLKNNLDKIRVENEIKADMNELFVNGNAVEKVLVVSAISAVKYYGFTTQDVWSTSCNS